ncbi:TetR/AcrR family transcriptional regulator [Aquimarina sp. AU58]|uniref:TetR/AcrR family transcriptional regulator n=1 Tax=Aquimarina sp. AU58 TaxID=1874112 RepID=UPI000D64B742|nr:TetR/AcrR family transcriptional regulator [Aquimarina sp. AU58]
MNQKIKSKETQNLIINSAFELFYKHGYNKTSIPEIIKGTGLSKGAFYHHFNSKKNIGEKVIDLTVRKRVYERMVAPLKNPDSAPVIPLLCDVFIKRIEGYSDLEKDLGCPANNLINEIGYSENSFREMLRDIIDHWQKIMVDLLEQGKIKGEIRKNVDTSATAIFLISAFEGVRGIRKVYNNDKILDEYLIAVKSYIEQLA